MRFMNETIRAAAVACLALALAGAAAFGQVKTEKSNLWKKLEAGQSCEVRVMGSSMSQAGKSFWPSELESQIDALVPGDVTVAESGTANGQTSATGRFDRLQGVIDRAPDALIVEYAFTDSRESKGLPLEEHIENMTAIVAEIRDSVPGVEVFIYETGRLSFATEESIPLLLDYYAATRQVAADMGTYLFRTAEKFAAVRDELVAQGRADDWAEYVYDSHHPSLKAAIELIVPEMLSVMQGLGSAPLEPSAGLSMQSLVGRSIYVADTIQLQWYYDASRISAVDVLLSVDGGQSYHSVIPSPVAASSILWAPPETVGGASAVSDQAIIKIRSSDGAHEDLSGQFTILPATDRAAIVIDEVAQTYRVGETLTVSWEKDPNRVEGVEVSLSVDGGRTYYALHKEAVNASSFDWTIPASIDGEGVLTSQAVIKVKAYSGTDESISSAFAIHGTPYIVDDQDPGAEIVGDWSLEARYPNGYNGAYLDDDRTGRGEKRVIYSYTPPATGAFAVYAWTPYAGTGIEDETPATITASDGDHEVAVHMKRITQWQYLGEYSGQAGVPMKVTITNNVSGGGTVVADAVKWEMTSGDATVGLLDNQRERAAAHPVTASPAITCANGVATISGAPPAAPLRLYDCAGRLRLRARAGKTGQARIDLRRLAPGAYTIRLGAEGAERASRRVIMP